MSFKCECCGKTQANGTTRKVYRTYYSAGKLKGNIASETPVCKKCHTALTTGSTFTEMRRYNEVPKRVYGEGVILPVFPSE